MGKNKPGFRTKGNVKASSSSKAAELCNIFTTSTENPFLINKEEQLDAEFLIANKKLSKKDSNTRIKGLQEIKQYIDSKEKSLLIPIIPSYFSSYAKAVLDDDKQVRELSNECLWLLLSKVREDSPRHLGDIAAVWLISQCDTNASVAALARKVFEETFKEGGRQRFVLMFQSHIIGVLKTNLYELQAENLTLYKTTEADLIEARHTRVLTSSIDAFTRLIMLSAEADRPKLFPKLLHVLFDERKFWAFGRSTHASLKRAFLELMASVVDMSLSINSSTLISTPTPHTLTASTPHNTTTPISQPHGTQTTSILTLQTYKKVDDNDKTAYSETDNAKTTQTSAIEIPSPDIVNDKQKDANTDNSIKDTVIDKNEASNDNTENNLADDKLNVGDNITNDLSNQTVLTTEHKTSIMKIILQVCTETNISVLPSFWRCFSVVLTALPDCWNYAKAEQTFSSKLWIILKKCHSVQNSHPNILSIVAHLPTNIKYHPLFYLQLLKTLSFSLKDNELRLGGQLKKIIAKTLMDNLKQYLTDIEFVSEGDHNDEKIMAIMGSLLEDSLLIAKCYPYADKIHLNIWGLFVFFHQIITNPVCSSNKKLRLESNYKIYANKIVEVIQKALEVDDSVQVRNKLVEFLNASNLEERTGRKKSVTFKEELLEDNEKMIDMTALGEHFHNSKMLDLYAKDSVFKDFVDEILLLCLKQLSSSNKHMYDNLNVHIVFTFFFRVYGQAELFKRFSNELDPNNRDQDYSEVITTKLLFSLIEKCSASNLSLVLKNIIFFSNFQAEQKEKYFFLRNYMRKNKDSLRNIGDIMKCFMARTQKDDSFKALFNEWVHEDKWAGDWFENNAIECCQKYLNLERDLQLWLPFAYSLANLKNPFSILNKLKPMIEACLSSDKVQVVVELLCKIIANLNEQNPHSVSNPSSLWFALKLLQTCLGEYAVNDFTYMQSLHTFINFFQIVLHKNSSEAGFSLENFQLLKQIKETIYNKIYEELIDTQTMDVWVDVMDKIMKITTNHTKEMIEFFPEKKGPQEIVLFWLQSKLFESYYELASNKEVHSMLHLSQITAYTTRFCNVFGELFHCKQNHTFLVYYKGFIEMFHRFLKFFFSEDIAAEVVQNILQRCFTHQENSELQLLSLVYFKGNTKIFDNTLNTSLKKLCDNFHSSYDEEILKCIMVLSLRCHVNFIGQSNAALRAWFDSTLSFETSKEKTSILTMVNVILKQSTDAETTKNLITNSHRYLKNVDQQLFLFDTLFNKEFSKFNCQVLQLYQSYYKLFCEEEVSEKSSTGATTLDKPIESEAENLDASEDILYEIWDSVSCSCYKWLQTITNTVSSNDKCFEVPLFKEFILNALNLLKTIQKYLPTAAKKHPSVMEEWHNVLEVSMMQHLCRLFKAPGLWDDVRTELCVCLHECPLQCLPTILPSVSSQATFDPDDNYSLDTYEAINELIVYFFTLLCPAGTPGNLKLSLHLQLFAHSLLKKLLQRYELLLSWRSQEKLVESGGEQFDLDFFAKVVIKAQKKILTSFDAKLYSKNFININHKPHMLSYFEYHLLFDLFIDVSRLYPSEFEKCLSTWPSPAEFFSNHMDILFSFIHDSPPKQLINDSINNLFSYFSFFFPPTHYIDGFSDIELYVLKYFNLKPLHHPLICLQQPLDEEAVISSSSMREIAFRTYVRTCHNMVLMIRPWFFKLGKTRSEFVNNYTTKYVSDGYIGKEMSSLKLKEGDLLPKMSIRQGSKQVSVSYKVDETQISLRVTYPSNAPLGNVSIEKDLDKISNMKKDVEMLIFRIFQLLQFREGSLADALELWYQTLDQEFDGRSCMICHSILATQDGNKYLPTIHCKTCHNRFHKSCLYTWFKSSNKSLCPLCRNEFVLL